MCSIVGYIGKNYCRSIIMEGLIRLEYRGYDSAGFVCLHPQDQRLIYTKTQGEIKNLINNLNDTTIDGFVALGHTRWSTHGEPTAENAHPHFDCNKNISVVHNGIITNYQEIKNNLELNGHTFRSQTDTEVIAHLLESLLNFHDLKDALLKLVKKIEGSYACAFLIQSHPDMIILIRRNSPLYIGSGDDETFITSDILGFANKSNHILSLPNQSFALVSKDKIDLYDFQGNNLSLNFEIIDINCNQNEKQGYEHFMLKEIYEQKKIIRTLVHKFKNFTDLLEQLGIKNNKFIKDLSQIHIVGCGSSGNVARIAKIFFETISKVDTTFYLASEIKHINLNLKKNSLAIMISQSGETLGTIESAKFFNEQNIYTIAITNSKTNSLAKECKGLLSTDTGIEEAVTTTKAFSAELATIYFLAHKIAYEKNLISNDEIDTAMNDLLSIAELIEGSIEDYRQIITQELAQKYSTFKNYLFLGRGISYPIAMEAALKVKEVTYIFCCAYPAGELKHGSITLIDNNLPVFIFSAIDELVYQKLLLTAEEIKSKNGHIISFAFKSQSELIELSDYAFIISDVKPLLEPFALVGLIQFFVYNLAKVLNKPIDKPKIMPLISEIEI